MNTNTSTGLQSTNTRLSGIERKKYDRDQVIFREHENGDVAYIIANGKVQIIKESDNGPKVLGVLEKGAMFGEMALIDNKPRMASAKAINGPVELLIVSKANFQKKMEQLDPFTRGLIKFMAEIVR
tara:strand:- start:270 stop:647 length:378 start_codon:yes stop_codon:yes gene_type:complete